MESERVVLKGHHRRVAAPQRIQSRAVVLMRGSFIDQHVLDAGIAVVVDYVGTDTHCWMG